MYEEECSSVDYLCSANWLYQVLELKSIKERINGSDIFCLPTYRDVQNLWRDDLFQLLLNLQTGSNKSGDNCWKSFYV